MFSVIGKKRPQKSNVHHRLTKETMALEISIFLLMQALRNEGISNGMDFISKKLGKLEDVFAYSVPSF
jgi:hypothetical protein